MKLHGSNFGISAVMLVIGSSGQAQDTTRPGQVAKSVVGQVGQRQNANSSQTNINPTGRIKNRIANRIQNRIDSAYNSTNNTTSPFEVAAEQVSRGQSAR